jgi:predicted nucleotidyltransferase
VPDDPIRTLSPTLRDLSRWFQDTHTPYLVIGGVAVSLVAGARTTKDVDAVVMIDEDASREFVASGAPYGFVSRIANPLSFAQASRMLLMRHEPDQIKVDISLAGLAFEIQAIEHGDTKNPKGINLRVPRVEDLIIMKAVASRPKDLADIDELLNVYPDIDREQIRLAITEFADLVERPDLIERLEPLLAQKRKRTSRRKPNGPE